MSGHSIVVTVEKWLMKEVIIMVYKAHALGYEYLPLKCWISENLLVTVA